MRSWTTFLIFGAILVGMVVFTLISNNANKQHPVLTAGEGFLAAVAANDAVTAERFLDPDAATITKDGTAIASIAFKQAKPFEGAFIKYDAAEWMQGELAGLKVADNLQPHVSSNGFATASLENGQKMFLRRVDGSWKVIYITRPKDLPSGGMRP